MPSFFSIDRSLLARPIRYGLLSSLALVIVLSAASDHAQFGAPSAGTQVRDTSALHPPAGARVAIVEFDDLECPACAAANQSLKDAAAKYQIPWIRHDFLIPSHVWSAAAAVNARWFDTKSKAIGDEYRNAVFANQNSIYNVGVLTQFTGNFAKSHGITMPFAIDPQGKLEAEVRADVELAKRMGLTSTPTIFIVTANSKGAPFIQVQNPQSELYSDIDRAMADTKPTPTKATPAKATPPRTR
jgi:protein-disulfide isomerase